VERACGFKLVLNINDQSVDILYALMMIGLIG